MALPPNIPKRGLSLSEAAEYCGVSDNTLIQHGPKPSKIGNRNVYDLKMLDRWLDSIAIPPPATGGGNLTIADHEQQILEALHARPRTSLRPRSAQRGRKLALVPSAGGKVGPPAGRSGGADGGGSAAQ
jgi:hypothetical protein